ncbi:DDE-type integrase/transposase/recombinase [Vibrio mediterranei]|nr:DDE-type integrase/transposase/recombinase [Vibrio mediterranei]MCG9790796.1 DDE-type integrase/transposase/recombinase [Vibrio mediterranei]
MLSSLIQDFSLSTTRNVKAAKRFLSKVLRSIKSYNHPSTLNKDKDRAYIPAILPLKEEGLAPLDTHHRQVKCMYNRVEPDHGKLKRLIIAVLAFQSKRTAYASPKGFEVMRMFRERWCYDREQVRCSEFEFRTKTTSGELGHNLSCHTIR